ncbi:MAG TPA: H-NS family nucleoid-associated regulatory protein [Gammaproteobacteria bacterium]|nr:H-NS family nucleoid-associated regulatory protein [Gammaproteobacteria bacterium]
MNTPINLESLGKEQLQALIEQGERRLGTLDTLTDLRELAEDERIYSIVNDILLLAYQTGVGKAEIFKALAGSLRQPLERIAEAMPQFTDDTSPGEAQAADEDMAGEEAVEPQQAAPVHRAGTLSLSAHKHSKPREREASAPQAQSGRTPRSGHKARPVYAHPVDRNKTWDGQGDMPQWLRDALSFGRRLEEFRVEGH